MHAPVVELSNGEYSILANEFDNGGALVDQSRNNTKIQNESNALVSSLFTNAYELIHYTNQAKSVFYNAEDGLFSLTNIFSSLFIRSSFFQNILDLFEKLFDNDKALRETIKKIEEAEIEFEKVIAIIIRNGNACRQQVEDDLMSSGVTSAFSESIEVYMQRKRIPDSFINMNIDGLLGENPDILRKGVTQGFYGEYWDPNVKEQCTFYAATRRTQLGRPLPNNGPWGNAVSWANSAIKAGLEVSKTPAPGDVFCQKGTWGHVGIVEGVLEDGTIVISEANNDFKGGYGVRKVSPRAYASWQFIK
jgi:hypothetical protein